MGLLRASRTQSKLDRLSTASTRIGTVNSHLTRCPSRYVGPCNASCVSPTATATAGCRGVNSWQAHANSLLGGTQSLPIRHPKARTRSTERLLKSDDGCGPEEYRCCDCEKTRSIARRPSHLARTANNWHASCVWVTASHGVHSAELDLAAACRPMMDIGTREECFRCTFCRHPRILWCLNSAPGGCRPYVLASCPTSSCAKPLTRRWPNLRRGIHRVVRC